jgi:small subunit ribosomal protein S21
MLTPAKRCFTCTFICSAAGKCRGHRDDCASGARLLDSLQKATQSNSFAASNYMFFAAKGGAPRLSEVIIHDDENFERALKRFKKKCEKAGILSDLRKHRHYEKPSERRKRKMNAAIRKNRHTRSG